MNQDNKKASFLNLAMWSVGLLSIYALSAIAPWWVFINIGPFWGVLVGLVAAIPWIFAVQYQPAGINMGPFAVPLLFNAFGVFVSWTLRL
ncbi:MAG: hypothetical protein HQL80_10980 [Magnetococcales bacterium]|nr:hypothetical protein [Magnetococcales bacterium]